MSTHTEIPYMELNRLLRAGRSVLLVMKTDIHGSCMHVRQEVRRHLSDDFRTLADGEACRFIRRDDEEVEGRLLVSKEQVADTSFDHVLTVENPVNTEVIGEQIIKFELRPSKLGADALGVIGPPWGSSREREPERCIITCTPAQFGLFTARVLSETGYRSVALESIRQVMTIRRTAPAVPEYDLTTKEE